MAQATSFYTLATDVSNNFFSGIWKLSRCMKAAGWVYKGSSDGTTKDTSGTAANDKWGGNANALLDTYPTALSGVVAWWVAQGPQIIKIPVGAGTPATGVFVRGEAVSQATSAATGECLGYVYDGSNGGWMVISPRTGTFDNTHVITGTVSSATLTPSGTVKTFTQEVAFIKDTSAQAGNIYWVMADASAESASLLSTLQGSAGCTATVGPGQGGTSNAFPTIMVCVIGEGGVTSGATNWVSGNTATTHCLIAAVNAAISSGVSADGTCWVMFNDTSSSTSNTYLIGLFRLDDGEQGDISPFEWIYPGFTTPGSYSRTLNPTQGSPQTYSNFTGSPYYIMQGYLARGTGTAGTAPDTPSYHKAATPYDQADGHPVWSTNNASAVRALNHPAATKPLAVDTVQLYNDVTNTQQIKGRMRWMRWASVGAIYDTTDGKTWVCWVPASGNTNPSLYVGPWDGSTVPAA